MKQIGIINKEDTALLVIDVQEKLMPVIHKGEQLIGELNLLIKGAQILQLPVIVTEQYPKGLGHTVGELQIPGNAATIQKVCFSCLLSGPLNMKLKSLNIHSLILCGVESHICVLKTALDALKEGFDVHVVADAVSSRTEANKKLALERMRQAGAFVVSTEMILFQLMDEAGTEEFKAISKLIR